MASYPDFICIGAQKAATTWLYRVLRRTPGVYLPLIKELHYFSELYCEDAKRYGPKHRARQITRISKKLARPDIEKTLQLQLDWFGKEQKNDDWYRAIFEFASDWQICGEICPSYMNMPVRGIRHVMSINPSVRIMVLVRDPVDRAWSHMRMHMKLGLLDFNIGKILSGKIPLWPYMRYTNYAGSLVHWKSMAGEGRFKPIVYDAIQNNPQLVIDEITNFIGLPQAETKKKLDENVFVGQQVELPKELRAKLYRDLEPQYAYLHAMFPNEVESWVDRHKLAMS